MAQPTEREMWIWIPLEDSRQFFQTDRMKVPGGWIVRTFCHGIGIFQTFVSETRAITPVVVEGGTP